MPLTPNMNLVQSVVGVDSGLTWEENLNASLATIDGHNHSPGYGVPITPAGLNINADLTFIGNNATNVKSVRFYPQGSPLAGAFDLGCIYESGVDLWFNDGNGNQIQITSGGSVNATSSGISSGTASASFVSSVLVVNAAPLIPANIQAGSILLGNNIVNSKFLTLSPPSSMPSNYGIILPFLPSVPSFVTIDNTGTMSTQSIAAYTASFNIVPTAGIIVWPTNSAPSGFLLCNGQAVSRTTYANLFSIIGTTFGPGDGSTTFNVPTQSALTFTTFGGTIPPYLHSYWHMDGSSTEFNVIQPTGYDLTMIGSVNSAPGKLNLSRGPFSNANYLNWNAAGSSSTPYDSAPFAIDGWINTSAGSPEGFIIGKENSEAHGWAVFMNSSGKMVFDIFGVGGEGVTSSASYNDGSWHYFAGIKTSATTGGVTNLYIDNVQVGTIGTLGWNPSTFNLQVGSSVGAGSIQNFVGLIDDVSYWNTVPSVPTFESIINNRWNSGAGAEYATGTPVSMNYIIRT